MFYFDTTYIIMVMPAMLFAMWASSRVNSTFAKYSKVRSSRNMTGENAARRVLDASGLYDVRIERVSGKLTDHYDPRDRVIRLSDAVYSNTSCAAIGVAAHEAGHAIQHAESYAPLKIRNAIIPVTQLGSTLAMPLVIIGILLSSINPSYVTVAYVGIIGFGATVLFQLVTLPTEFNASNRALRAIENSNMLEGAELKGAKKVLSAAALTYVAALAVSLTQMLYLMLRVAGSRRD